MQCIAALQRLLLWALGRKTLWFRHVQDFHFVRRRHFVHTMWRENQKLPLTLIGTFQRIPLHHLQRQGPCRLVHEHIVFVQQAEGTLNLHNNSNNNHNNNEIIRNISTSNTQPHQASQQHQRTTCPRANCKQNVTYDRSPPDRFLMSFINECSSVESTCTWMSNVCS